MEARTRVVAGIAVVVVVVAGVVAASRLRQQKKPWEDIPQRPLSDAAKQRAAQPLFVGTVPDATSLRQKTAAAVRSKLAKGLKGSAEADRIAATVSTAVSAFNTGTLDDYVTLLQSQGLTTDRPSMPKSQAGWESTTMLVRGQPLDLEHINVVAVVVAGRQVAQIPPTPGMQNTSVTLSKPRGDQDVLEPLQLGTDVVEVMIPGRLRGLAGEFNGSLRLGLARRPKDGQWIIISIGAMDIPDTNPAGLPPL
jgi:hypothetical protein